MNRSSRIGSKRRATPSGRTEIFRPWGSVGVSSCQLGFAKVEITTAGDSVWAYASIMDNDSVDPTTVPVTVE